MGGLAKDNGILFSYKDGCLSMGMAGLALISKVLLMLDQIWSYIRNFI